MRKLPLAVAGLLLVPFLIVLAQEEKVLKVDVDVVSLFFTVREKKGALVGNLNKEDFSIAEDGKPQTIKYFTRENDLPLTIGLLVDVSGSQANLIEVEKHAASQFFARVLRPKDMAFLISFGSDAELLQDYTNSTKLLRAGLDGLKVNSDVSGISGNSGPVPTASRPHGTILYDTVYLASHDQLTGQVGRKALVLITDGVDQGSRYKIEQAIEQAQKADAIIYSIYYMDNRAYGGHMSFGGGGEGYLKKMSEETGGRVMKVDNKNSLENIFDQISQELRSQYSIGYTPTNPSNNGGFRRVEVHVPQREKELKVQVRKGYYAANASR
jgi:VWFA-related protein